MPCWHPPSQRTYSIIWVFTIRDIGICSVSRKIIHVYSERKFTRTCRPSTARFHSNKQNASLYINFPMHVYNICTPPKHPEWYRVPSPERYILPSCAFSERTHRTLHISAYHVTLTGKNLHYSWMTRYLRVNAPGAYRSGPQSVRQRSTNIN